MKKLFLVLVCTALFSATFVLSSYKTNDNNASTKDNTTAVISGEYTFIGKFGAYPTKEKRANYRPEKFFGIWETEGMCNNFYWGYNGHWAIDKDFSDNAVTGPLRKTNDGIWYAVYDGVKYYILDFE